MNTANLVEQLVHSVARSSEIALVAASVCGLFEWLLPASRCSLGSRVRGALFRLIYIVFSAQFALVFQFLLLRFNARPLFSIRLDGVLATAHPTATIAALAVALLMSLLIGDFFYYWFHRAQHTNAILWQFHQVHHSIREMNAWNSNHHLLEELIRIPFIALPMALLIDFTPGTIPAVIGVLLVLQGTYQHADTRLSMGALRYVLPDNRFHRIHHSIETRHYNKNFGASVVLWDVLFRTACFPAARQWPAVGLDYADEPRRIIDYVTMPFTTRMPTDNPAATDPIRRGHDVIAKELSPSATSADEC